MSKKLGQEPAYPMFNSEGLPTYYNGQPNLGISTRLYLAGMAMQGIMANHKVTTSFFTSDYEKVARWSLEQADELLKQYENEN